MVGLYVASGHHRIMGGQQLRALVMMVLGKGHHSRHTHRNRQQRGEITREGVGRLSMI